MIPQTFKLDPKLVQEILDYPGQYKDDNEESTCRKLIEALDEDEIELAARTTYAYWYLQTCLGEKPSKEMRLKTAMKEARRYLASEGNYKDALEKMRESCQFRKEKKIDLLRLCFAENSTSYVSSEDDKQQLVQWEEMLRKEYERHPTLVAGHDKQKRVILHRRCRLVAEVDEEEFYLLFLYMCDRAVSCTEILTKGREEKIHIMMDYNTWVPVARRPAAIVKQSLSMMQKLCFERIGLIYMIDPRTFTYMAFTVLSPLLPKVFREKVCMVSGKKQKDKVFESFDPHNATPTMLENGTLLEGADIQSYLLNIPMLNDYLVCQPSS